MAKPDLRQALSNINTLRQTEASPERSQPPENGSPQFRPSRVGKAPVTGHYPREVRKQLRMMAADQDTTIEELLAEAINDLFPKYGRPEIVPRKAR